MARLSFRNVASGWHPFAPPRSLDPSRGGPTWRHLNNLRWHDGVLEFRRAVRPPPGSVTQPPVDYPTDIRIELPVAIFQVHTGSTAGTTSSSLEVGTIAVTSTDIYAHTSSGWAVLTPTYTTGTISYTSGSTSVTGAGTSWTSRFIKGGQQILLGSEWRRITAVTGNTTMTVATAPTTTAAGAAYTIRRTFNGTAPNSGNYFTDRVNVYAKMFNGDLYVGGTSLGGFGTPAILRVTDPFSSPVTEYLVASDDLTGSLDVIDLTAIHGLDVLQDGRVLASVTEVGSGFRVSRLRFSSPTDQLEWAATPAGFVDVVNGGKGKITAQGTLGDHVTVHYEDKVALGILTGEDNRPLDVRGTRARAGAGLYRSLKEVGGVEMYVDTKGIVRAFDGSTDRTVSAAFREMLRAEPIQEVPWNGFAHFDRYRDEYQLFYLSPPGLADKTFCLSVSLGDGSPRREDFRYVICAASDEYLSSPGVAAPEPDGTHEDASCLIAFSAGATVNAEPMAVLRERVGEDDDTLQTFGGTASNGIRAETDELDFGDPSRVDVVERVVVRMRKPANSQSASTTDEIKVSLSIDGGATYPAGLSDTKTFTYSAAGVPDTQRFFFDHLSALTFKIRIESTDNEKLVGSIEWVDVEHRTLHWEEALP